MLFLPRAGVGVVAFGCAQERVPEGGPAHGNHVPVDDEHEYQCEGAGNRPRFPRSLLQQVRRSFDSFFHWRLLPRATLPLPAFLTIQL